MRAGPPVGNKRPLVAQYASRNNGHLRDHRNARLVQTGRNKTCELSLIPVG